VYGVLLECAVTAEKPGVSPEHSFIKILEGWVAVDIIWYDSRPPAPTAVASSPTAELFEFASGVSPVVPTVSTAALPLVLEVAFEGVRKRYRISMCR
jgi:hypothetical protein